MRTNRSEHDIISHLKERGMDSHGERKGPMFNPQRLESSVFNQTKNGAVNVMRAILGTLLGYWVEHIWACSSTMIPSKGETDNSDMGHS